MSDSCRSAAPPSAPKPTKRRQSKAEKRQPEGELLALRLLARREHSAAELRRKLRLRGLDHAEIEAALRDLAAQGWQDDQRFAESYAAGRAARGCGPLRIVAELEERGVTASEAQAALQTVGGNWDELAAAALHRRFGSGPVADLSDRARRMRFLQRRGFSQAQSTRALSSAEPNDAEQR